ncbi:MAG: hypothetical protein GY829_15690, partial [Gammaproteobacteria bacterium]|nr:hypothetical protein [Gammaproteobacteria bacterium]
NIDKNGVVTENQGFLGPVFDGLGAVSNIYFGMKGLDLAEEQFDFQKEAFEKNYEANKLAFNNAVRRRGDAAANAVSNEVLGISDNATLAERAAAEEAYSTSQTANKVI